MYSFTLKSSNSKTGPIPVTYSPKGTCPDACIYKAKDGEKQGCYAEEGWYTDMHWNRITAGTAGIGWDEMIRRIWKLPEGQVWRHNIAGDLPHVGGLAKFPDTVCRHMISTAAMVMLCSTWRAPTRILDIRHCLWYTRCSSGGSHWRRCSASNTAVFDWRFAMEYMHQGTKIERIKTMMRDKPVEKP